MYRTGHDIDVWYRPERPTDVTAMPPGAFGATVGVFLTSFGSIVTALVLIAWGARFV